MNSVVLLGTCGYHPTRTRHTPCFLLPDSGVMLDAGTVAYALPDYLQTEQLDIFLSHAHLDRAVGLTYFTDLKSAQAIFPETVLGKDRLVLEF